MINPGDVISYYQMCSEEGTSLQRGMNFRPRGGMSVILMSLRKNSPYADRVEDDGRVLIYEGHDAPRNTIKNPKKVDQPRISPKGTITQNSKFENAVTEFKNKKSSAELVKVYEKIKSGIWVYGGIFELQDSWQEESNGRKVFKFKLVVTDLTIDQKIKRENSLKKLEHNRIIPTSIKVKVWQRDKGKCVFCGSSNNLHFDHILPFSKGGTSLKEENIQLLCARHNLQKSDKII